MPIFRATTVTLLLVLLTAPAASDDSFDLDKARESFADIKIEAQSLKEIREAVAELKPLLVQLDAAVARLQDKDKASTLLDTRLLRAQVKRRLFELNELKLHELVPGRYFALSKTSSLFIRPCSSPDAAISAAKDELDRLPEVLGNARKNLKRPARTWTENALVIARYAEQMLTKEINDVCVDDAALRSELLSSAAAANAAIQEFRSWMVSDLLPRSDRSPAWTPQQIEVYQFEHEFLGDYGVDRMIEIATENEAATRTEMQSLARRIHPSGDLRTVWELMKDETPPWDEVPAMAERYVELADDWLRGEGKHLVEIPERFDYGVQITAPMGRRVLSFGGASYGPTMAGRISGYYVLTPLEPWLTEEEASSRLRSYNPYWTHVISYHEWLGHNVQRAIAHEFADTPIRRSFQSIYLSQAWSFYLEKLLDDEGYFEDVLPHMEALKTRMARLQMRMWRIQRILTKLKMAKGEMSFDEAIEAYVDEIGMEPTNALIEVQRDSQSPSPPGREIIGEKYILDLRREYERRLGEHATLRGFHEALLRYGNLPLPVVRQLMFGDL